ncbi:PIN-like domain-containing protein [Streptomyces sp. TLI_171]|uniref:PIN-like domain-containing protein n=1 Tax=Streptomyces sp. TLI_171 TaxID=1938859 RepID=UPI00117D3283|nr:PIN-like domain-containing protein [Streptomyces sp. TLI_171]
MNEESTDDRGSKSLHEWFPAYHPKGTPELSSLIQSGLIALDANVLLDLYRYIPQARDELVAALRKLGDRLWVPHRAGLEFHERRFNAIANQQRSFDDATAALNQAKIQAVKALEQLQATCSIRAEDTMQWIETLEEAFLGVDGSIQNQRQHLDIDPDSAITGDHVLTEIDELLNGKVGPPLESEALSKLRIEAPDRFEKKIPPGFEDSGKPNDLALGDLIMWEQLLLEAAGRRLPVLLVSREQKPDWVRRRNEHVLGPHPLLVEEMRDRAGVAFHLIHPGDFLRHAKEALRVVVSPSTVEAVTRKSGPEIDQAGRRAAIHRRLVHNAGPLSDSEIFDQLEVLHQRVTKLAERQRAMHSLADSSEQVIEAMKQNPENYSNQEREDAIRKYFRHNAELDLIGQAMVEVDAEWKDLTRFLSTEQHERVARMRPRWKAGHWAETPDRHTPQPD